MNGESFLFPDQDNGFILDKYPDDRHTSVDAYFIELARRVTIGGSRLTDPDVFGRDAATGKPRCEYDGLDCTAGVDCLETFEPAFGFLRIGGVLHTELREIRFAALAGRDSGPMPVNLTIKV